MRSLAKNSQQLKRGLGRDEGVEVVWWWWWWGYTCGPLVKVVGANSVFDFNNTSIAGFPPPDKFLYPFPSFHPPLPLAGAFGSAYTYLCRCHCSADKISMANTSWVLVINLLHVLLKTYLSPFSRHPTVWAWRRSFPRGSWKCICFTDNDVAWNC